MNEFGYEESHSLTDQRLAICTVACTLSLGALVYDYFFPFPASKYVLGFCSLGYFTLMLVFTIFVAFKEKNYVYWGVQKDKAGLVNPSYKNQILFVDCKIVLFKFRECLT
jgi:signal peptidase complex subunit 2